MKVAETAGFCTSITLDEPIWIGHDRSMQACMALNEMWQLAIGPAKLKDVLSQKFQAKALCWVLFMTPTQAVSMPQLESLTPNLQSWMEGWMEGCGWRAGWVDGGLGGLMEVNGGGSVDGGRG